MFIYESHLGGLLVYNSEQEDTYCETCGDSDWLIGEFDSAVEFLAYYADCLDADDGYGGIALEHTLEVLNDTFDDCPTREAAIDIILKNRTEDEEYEEGILSD